MVNLKTDKMSLSRRSLVQRIGVGGLMAAAVVAVGEKPASAAVTPNQYLCCNLALSPTFPYSTCSNRATYIWGCYSGAEFCSCCEVATRNSDGSYHYIESSIHCGP